MLLSSEHLALQGYFFYLPTLGYTVGSGTVVVLGRRGYGVIVLSIRRLLIEWHHFRGIVGRIDVRLPCPTGLGT